MTTLTPNRGEVWFIRFDPSIGAEQQKTRPAVVMSEATMGILPLRIVVPITDWKVHYVSRPWFVYLPPDAQNGLTKQSGADAFQVKSVSMRRFRDRIGVLTATQMEEIAAAVALCVGYSP